MWDSLLDLLFPRSCLGCGIKNMYLCAACAALLPLAERDSREISALYAYRDPLVRKAILKLKYKRGRSLAPLLGTLLGEFLLEELDDWALEGFREPLLVPVPLSGERLHSRGYNQAELWAREVARTTSLPLVVDNLVKIRDTESQVRRAGRAARLANLHGAFSLLQPERIAGRNIIVIDDVYTTGTTMREVMRTLSNGAPREIRGLCLAH